MGDYEDILHISTVYVTLFLTQFDFKNLVTTHTAANSYGLFSGTLLSCEEIKCGQHLLSVVDCHVPKRVMYLNLLGFCCNSRGLWSCLFETVAYRSQHVILPPPFERQTILNMMWYLSSTILIPAYPC